MRIYSLIFLAMLGVVVWDVAWADIGALLALLGLIVGTLLGSLASRMYRLSWDEASNKVIARIDRLGFVILVFYIAFEVFRNQLFGHWLQGATLGAFSFSVLAGLMLGQASGTRHGIRRVLEAWHPD
jgi:Kef-type K+ transport system membrane component KefB